ncbi:hypothetical protein THRCLA_06899 [Thraustotheca clavata]|uniref:Uncharacterized protein n=1 Tax=Thraustotheca clavata TaxID=74557 RepID=A0A1V9ZIB5_9STRA|nr:hypothetical protein THRCLA_06899 [Thraustotheca clavata]
MGVAMSWCTEPGSNDCSTLDRAPSPLLLKMPSFSFDGDENYHRNDVERNGPETPGAKLLRDYCNHVVETDSGRHVQPYMNPYSPPILEETLLKTPSSEKDLPMLEPSIKEVKNNEPYVRKPRAASVDTFLPSPLRSPSSRRELTYKPFWCDLPSRPTHPSPSAAS